RDSEQLLELLRSDDAMSHVSAALGMFDPEIAARFEDLRAFATRLRDHLNAVGVAAVGDAIPRPVLARLLSRLIAGDESIETGLVPLIRDVTEGRGMDLCAAKSLLRAAIGDRRLDYEIDGLMRWVDLVTRPSEPLARAAAVEEPPLVDDPRYAEAIAGLPSAADIYRAVEKEAVPAATPERVAELAPYLTLGQIDHVLDGAEAKWPAAAVARLRRVRDVKRKVARIDEAEWGVALGAQAVRVGAFIGEAVGPLPGVDEAAPECALGPRDVAVLLQTGLAEGRQGLQAQINNRLLIELIRSRPGEFLREVLVEMGHQVPRILTGVLWAFLHQDQDELAGPLDLAGLLSEKLGLPVPRQEDYMAGGRKARGSYYEALSKLSDAIFAGAGPYLARRARLREVRHEVPPWPRPEGSSARLESEAIAAVTAADALGAKCSFDGADGAAHRRARAAYRTAFEACAALLREVPDGFQLPWLREFWSRNEEALKVLSVVRNWQEDVDDVRHWLAVVSGRPVRRAEQALVETVVRCLYACPEDRDALAADPLVRLLLDPEPGPWAFTVVSCMGVVTEGREGHELDETYRRLAERRGVRVVRAHTGLFRSLEHNAAAILKEVRGIRGDWGYVGYSQGCANALVAESFLRGGTPEEQRLLGGLRCRNLLFSAANGSVHGTSGALKFTRAMVEGERFLKHYQASHSREVVSIALRAMRTVMDSRAFLNALGGTFSLSLERARALHREGQFLPWVPTSTTRGAVTPDRLAEALEYLWYCHEGLLPGAPHDSQVPAEEAVGHATRIRNCRTEVLARCDMGSRVQATHHWSPLTTEIEFVTTDRDRARAVYLSPKDRHVFPWLEVNARFGRIG
ncbi:MAG: hypothetical protein FJ087_21190, partial [Deltaproteobacteria bacterium]|nr:hypothetical protein [Deltaproteobacteria bacterium]